MLDQLSHGRLEIGVGRGRSPIELVLFGGSVAEAQGVFDEALAILQLAFCEDSVHFAGRHYEFQGVPVELRPLQRPHPPLWYGIGTPESAEEYGARGFHGVTLAKPQAAAEIARRFTAASRRSGWRGRRIGICRFIVVGETDREALDLASRAYPVWPASFEEMAASGLAFAGSPRTLREALSAQLQSMGANYLAGQFVFGDMSLAESAKSIGLFADEVMPELARAHGAARQVAAATKLA